MFFFSTIEHFHQTSQKYHPWDDCIFTYIFHKKINVGEYTKSGRNLRAKGFMPWFSCSSSGAF